MLRSGTALSRGGWTLTAVAIVSVWFTGPAARSAFDSLIGADFPKALLGLGTLVQLVIALWVLVVIGIAALVGPTALLQAVTPRMLRSALFIGTAGALAIAPAQADQSAAHSTEDAVVNSLAGLPFPDRPLIDQPASTTVVVRPGDTLWAIARRWLPDGASDADVAAACHRWHAANRAVIGPNPDLIKPAQHLSPPTKDDS